MKLFLIALGSNIGERKSYIMNAITELSIRAGEIEAVERTVDWTEIAKDWQQIAPAPDQDASDEGGDF